MAWSGMGKYQKGGFVGPLRLKLGNSYGNATRKPCLIRRSQVSAFRIGASGGNVSNGAVPVAKKATRASRQTQSVPPPQLPINNLYPGLGMKVLGGLVLVAASGAFASRFMQQYDGRRDQRSAGELHAAVSQATQEAQTKLGDSLEKKETELKALVQATRALEVEVSSKGQVGGRGHAQGPPEQVADAAVVLKESQRKVALLEAMVTTLRVRLREEEDRSSRLSDEVESGQEELLRADSQRLELELRVVQLKGELDDATERLVEAEAQAQKLQEHVDALKSHNSVLEGRVRELEDSLSMRTKEAEVVATTAERRIAELKSEADSAASALSRLQAALDDRESQLEDMKRVVEANKVSAAKMEALLSSSDAEMVALSESLRNSVDEAMSLYRHRDAELSTLKEEMKKLQEQAEEEASLRSKELHRVRLQLEEQLSSARIEAQSARDELRLIKQDMDTLLQDDLPHMLQEIKQSDAEVAVPLGLAASHGVFGAQGSKQTNHLLNMSVPQLQRAIEEMSARERRLTTEIRYRQEELSQQRRLLAPRLKVELISQVQDMETCIAAVRAQLRRAEQVWERDGVGAQTVSRLQRELASVSANLAALYRSSMSPEMQERERALSGEIKDREAEMKNLVAQIARHQEQLKIKTGSTMAVQGGKGSSSSNGGSGSSSGKDIGSGMSVAVRKRLKGLFAEQMEARAERERERERELQARLEASEAAYRAQVSQVQEHLSGQIRSLEEVWKQQLSASQLALAQTENEKQRLQAEATISAVQVRQQLLELQQLREDLSAQSKSLQGMQDAYEQSRLSAEMRMGASQAEMASVAKEVLKLQEQLQVRESEMAELAVKQASKAVPPSDFPSPWPSVPLPKAIQHKGAGSEGNDNSANTASTPPPPSATTAPTAPSTSSPIGGAPPPAVQPAGQGEDAASAYAALLAAMEKRPPSGTASAAISAAGTPSTTEVLGAGQGSGKLVVSALAGQAAGNGVGAGSDAAVSSAMGTDVREGPGAEPTTPAAMQLPDASAGNRETADADSRSGSSSGSSSGGGGGSSSSRADETGINKSRKPPAPSIHMWGRPKAAAPPVGQAPTFDSASAPAAAAAFPAPHAGSVMPNPETVAKQAWEWGKTNKPAADAAAAAPPSTPTLPSSSSEPSAASAAASSAAAPGTSSSSAQPSASPGASSACSQPAASTTQPPQQPSPLSPLPPLSTPSSSPSSVFPEEDELGSMVASITQSLLQKGAVPPSLGAGQAPPSQLATTGGGQGSSSRQQKGSLKLVSGGHMVPHQDKVEKGGEDAWFASAGRCGAFGVADGVGGWAEEDVNPADYPRAVMRTCQQQLESLEGGGRDLIEVLEYTQSNVTSPGSCTLCLAVMRPEGVLEVANLGDAGVRVIRGTKLAFATTAQEHQFNMPYQMASPSILPETDLASDAQTFRFELREGDVVVAGSDGLFDNMWDDTLVQQVYGYMQRVRRESLSSLYHPVTAQQLAKAIAIAASATSRDTQARTPWSVESAAQQQGPQSLFDKLFARGGGKMDDITVIVSIVGPA